MRKIILAVISIIFWIMMLIKDTKEYIDLREMLGKEYVHITLIVLDTIFLSFTVWAIYCMLR